MTKQEKQMKQMLNYFQIDMSNGKDELMSKKEKQNLLDRINESYDQQLLEDVFKKIKDKIDSQREEDEQNMDNMDLFSEEKLDDEFIDPNDDYSDDPLGFRKPPMDKIPDGTQIESFLLWMRSLLYSGNHMVVVDGDGKNITNIKIMKIKGGKGK